MPLHCGRQQFHHRNHHNNRRSDQVLLRPRFHLFSQLHNHQKYLLGDHLRNQVVYPPHHPLVSLVLNHRISLLINPPNNPRSLQLYNPLAFRLHNLAQFQLTSHQVNLQTNHLVDHPVSLPINRLSHPHCNLLLSLRIIQVRFQVAFHRPDHHHFQVDNQPHNPLNNLLVSPPNNQSTALRLIQPLILQPDLPSSQHHSHQPYQLITHRLNQALNHLLSHPVVHLPNRALSQADSPLDNRLQSQPIIPLVNLRPHLHLNRLVSLQDDLR